MKNSKNLSLLSRLGKLQRLFLVALFSVLAIGAAAQSKTVSGTVTDKTGQCSSKRYYKWYNYRYRW